MIQGWLKRLGKALGWSPWELLVGATIAKVAQRLVTFTHSSGHSLSKGRAQKTSMALIHQ